MKKKILRDMFDDLLVLAGLGSMVFGIYQLNPPIAFVVGGFLILTIGLFRAWIVAVARRTNANLKRDN